MPKGPDWVEDRRAVGRMNPVRVILLRLDMVHVLLNLWLERRSLNILEAGGLLDKGLLLLLNIWGSWSGGVLLVNIQAAEIFLKRHQRSF